VVTKIKQGSLVVCLFLFLFVVIGGGLHLNPGGAFLAAATGTPLVIHVFNRRCAGMAALWLGSVWRRLWESTSARERSSTSKGKLQTSTWEDKQSSERKYRTEIIARDIVLLGSRDVGEKGRPETHGEESNTEPVASAVADSDIPF
jgi:hypothetical protein